MLSAVLCGDGAGRGAELGLRARLGWPRWNQAGNFTVGSVTVICERVSKSILVCGPSLAID